MKTYINLFIIFIFAALGCGCSKVSLISIQILEPGGINLPAHIKTVALVDRSFPPDPLKKTAVGIFTGETMVKDRMETQKVLSGLNDILRNSIRLQPKLTNVQLIGSQNGGIFPPPLDQETINQICKDNNTDAVIALEDFSSNSPNTAAKTIVQIAQDGVKNGILGAIEKGISTAAQQQSPNQASTIKLGFRLYDNVNNTIYDQYSFTSSFNWTTDAQGNVINTNYTIYQASYNAGMVYAKRIAPTFMWVNRKFYKRSKNAQMGIASRMALTGDWKGASELWLKLVNQLGRKKAGRAAFNLALAYEVAGDLKQAQSWCEKSYAVYNNKKAKGYAQILNQRVWEVNRIQQQMQDNNK